MFKRNHISTGRKNVSLATTERCWLYHDGLLIVQKGSCKDMSLGLQRRFAQKNTVRPVQGAPADSPQVPSLSSSAALLHFHLSIPTHSDLCTGLLLDDPFPSTLSSFLIQSSSSSSPLLSSSAQAREQSFKSHFDIYIFIFFSLFRNKNVYHSSLKKKKKLCNQFFSCEVFKVSAVCKSPLQEVILPET